MPLRLRQRFLTSLEFLFVFSICSPFCNRSKNRMKTGLKALLERSM